MKVAVRSRSHCPAPNSEKRDESRIMIEIKNLTKSFQTADGSMDALKDVSLTIEDGDIFGITAPGIRISAKALWEDTAKLPEIEIKKPDTILGKDTITSMQSGLVYGQIGQTEYIIKKTKEETGLMDAKVVVTGGLGRIISGETG